MMLIVSLFLVPWILYGLIQIAIGLAEIALGLAQILLGLTQMLFISLRKLCRACPWSFVAWR
jgi:hypothetical protein